MSEAVREAIAWPSNDATAETKLNMLSLEQLKHIYADVPQADADAADDRLRSEGEDHIADFTARSKSGHIQFLLHLYPQA